MNKKLLFTLCAALLMVAATAQDKNEAIAAFNEGLAAMNASNNAEALAAFERAISVADEVGDEAADVRKNAENATISLRKKVAQALYAQKSYEEALKAMEEARRDAQKFRNEKELAAINKALPTLYNAMGNKDTELGLYAEAVDCYQKGIDINPNMSKLHLGLGNAYQKMDSAEQALAAFDRATEVAMRTNQPGDAIDARRLAKGLLMKNGQEAKNVENFKKAYEFFNAAVKYDENDPDVHLQVAIVANRNGQPKDAIAAAEKALSLEKRDNMRAKIFYQLGYAYEQAGEKSKACSSYKKVPASDSDKANANGAMKRLKCE